MMPARRLPDERLRASREMPREGRHIPSARQTVERCRRPRPRPFRRAAVVMVSASRSRADRDEDVLFVRARSMNERRSTTRRRHRVMHIERRTRRR